MASHNLEEIFERYFKSKRKPASARAAPLASASFENCCERKTLLNVGGELFQMVK